MVQNVDQLLEKAQAIVDRQAIFVQSDELSTKYSTLAMFVNNIYKLGMGLSIKEEQIISDFVTQFPDQATWKKEVGKIGNELNKLIIKEYDLL